MPITISCPCQNTYRVKDELAGKRIKCPHCQQPVSVPLSDMSSTPENDPFFGHETAAAPPSQQSNPYGDQSYNPHSATQQFGQPSSANALDTIAQDYHQDFIQQRHSSGVNVGKVLGGIGMMVGGVILLFLGLMGNRLIIYAPILFIIGLVTFIKGLVGASS